MNMSTSNLSLTEEIAFSSGRQVERFTNAIRSKKGPVMQKRQAPQRFNGMHRRRRKKIMW